MACLAGTASCTQHSLLDLETVPNVADQAAIISIVQSPVAVPEQPVRTLLTRRETIELQLVRSVIASGSGNLIMYFSGANDLSDLQLIDQQTLDFVDPDGQQVSLTFSVAGTTVVDQLLEVEFANGRSYGDDLDPETEQSIIIEDVVVN